MTTRANPFADTEALPAFAPKPKSAKPIETEQLDQIAEATGFPSRQAVRALPANPRARRRYKTGRNQQINIKATPEAIERLYKLADARRVPLGRLLEQALDALEKSGSP
jgi:hypothetical protein